MQPLPTTRVGYSAAEVIAKEVEEETGIEVEPVRVIAVLDGFRLGMSRIPLYTILFYCRAIGGELNAHPLEVANLGWFTPENLPTPLVSYERWGEHVFAGIEHMGGTCLRTIVQARSNFAMTMMAACYKM